MNIEEIPLSEKRDEIINQILSNENLIKWSNSQNEKYFSDKHDKFLYQVIVFKKGFNTILTEADIQTIRLYSFAKFKEKALDRLSERTEEIKNIWRNPELKDIIKCSFAIKEFTYVVTFDIREDKPYYKEFKIAHIGQ